MKPTYIVLTLLVVAGVFARLLPHPPNFTPLLATALVAGLSTQRKGIAIALPLVTLWLSDLVVTNVVYAQYYDSFQLFGDPSVYLGVGLVALLPYMMREHLTSSWLRLTGLGLAGSVLFFLVSNFGTWLLSGMYPLTATGLTECFIAALPFFRYTLAATLCYGAVGVAIMRYVTARETTSSLALN